MPCDGYGTYVPIVKDLRAFQERRVSLVNHEVRRNYVQQEAPAYAGHVNLIALQL